MHCVPIGPYYWSFVRTFCPCILILCVPLEWSFVLAYTVHHVHHCIHDACAKNNTTYHNMPMLSHNLSLVEKCVKKSFLISHNPCSTCSTSHHSLCLNYCDFKSLFAHTMLSPYGVREHVLMLVHTSLCIQCIRCANSTVQFLSTSLTHTHTHTTLMQRDTYMTL